MKEKACYNNLLADVMHICIQGYKNIVRMPPVVFDLCKQHLYHRIKKEITNFRKSLDVLAMEGWSVVSEWMLISILSVSVDLCKMSSA